MGKFNECNEHIDQVTCSIVERIVSVVTTLERSVLIRLNVMSLVLAMLQKLVAELLSIEVSVTILFGLLDCKCISYIRDIYEFTLCCNCRSFDYMELANGMPSFDPLYMARHSYSEVETSGMRVVVILVY